MSFSPTALVVGAPHLNGCLIAASLDELGIETDLAATAHAARERLQARRYDVCILDLDRLGWHAAELAETLRSLSAPAWLVGLGENDCDADLDAVVDRPSALVATVAGAVEGALEIA